MSGSTQPYASIDNLVVAWAAKVLAIAFELWVQIKVSGQELNQSVPVVFSLVIPVFLNELDSAQLV